MGYCGGDHPFFKLQTHTKFMGGGRGRAVLRQFGARCTRYRGEGIPSVPLNAVQWRAYARPSAKWGCGSGKEEGLMHCALQCSSRKAASLRTS